MRMKKNEDLNMSEEKFRLLFEKSYEPILIIDGYKFIECNDATVKKLKYKSRKDICNTHPSELSPKYQPDGKLSYEKANEMMDIAYKIGYHRFEWIHCDTQGNEFVMDIAITKIPYRGKDMLFTTWRDITKQKEFENELIQREKQLSLLFEQSADGILVGIQGGEIVAANESICNLTGYNKDELIGANISILFEKSELNNKPLRYDLVKSGDTVIKERNIRKKDESVIPVEMNTKQLEDGRMQALFRDLTKRKKAENLLKESKEKYKNIFLNSPLGIFHYNMDGVITDCNDHFVQIIGSSKKVLVGLNMFTDLNNKVIIESVKKSLKEGEAYYEDWYTSVTGHKSTYVRILFKGIENKEQKIISGIGLVEDITDRKKAEQELIQSEEKFKTIATLLPEVVFEIDLKGNLTFVNLKALEIFGYTQEDFEKGLTVFQMLAPFEIERVKENISRITDNQNNKGEKYIAVTKSGKQFPILIYSDFILKDSKPVGLRGIIVNISELEKAQDKIKESEEKFRNIYDSSSDIIMILTRKGQVVDVNKTVEKHFGYSVDEFKTKTIQDYVSANDLDEVYYRIDKMFKGEKMPIREMKMIAKNGEEVPVEVNSKIIDYNGAKTILSQIRNIKERKDLEQRIYETMIETEEKERQRLASDIHDEIGPLLSSLKMYIESLNDTTDLEKQKFITGKLKSLIKESITNVREVSNALSPYLLRKYGLKAAINSFFESSRDLIHIDSKINLDKERFPINTETVFFRIIKELFNNTIKHAKAKKIKVLLTYSGNKLYLLYEDDGKGIKQEELNNLAQKGMGLLNITNRIKSINGSYKFYTKNRKGFKIEVLKATEIIK